MYQPRNRKAIGLCLYLGALVLLTGASSLAIYRETSNYIIVPWSRIPVQIDGNLQGYRSGGGSEWWDGVAFASWDGTLSGYLKHNSSHLFIGIQAADNTQGSSDWIYMIFEEGNEGTRGGGSTNNQFDRYAEDYKFMLFDGEIMHLFKGDGYYLGNNAWYAIGGPSFPPDFAGDMTFLGNRWEIEFAIPFSGHEGIAYDLSDLTIELEDTFRWYIAFNSYSPGSIPETVWHSFPNVKWPPLAPDQMVSLYLSPFPSHVTSSFVFFEIIIVFNIAGIVLVLKPSKQAPLTL